jgi:hypothetical protein
MRLERRGQRATVEHRATLAPAAAAAGGLGGSPAQDDRQDGEGAQEHTPEGAEQKPATVHVRVGGDRIHSISSGVPALAVNFARLTGTGLLVLGFCCANLVW